MGIQIPVLTKEQQTYQEFLAWAKAYVADGIIVEGFSCLGPRIATILHIAKQGFKDEKLHG